MISTLTSMVTPTNTLIVALFALGVAIIVVVRQIVRIDELWEYIELLENQQQQSRLDEFTKGLKIGKHFAESQQQAHSVYSSWHDITMPTLERIEQAQRAIGEGGGDNHGEK